MKKWFKPLAFALALAVVFTSLQVPLPVGAITVPDSDAVDTAPQSVGDVDTKAKTNTSDVFPQTDTAYQDIMSAANGGQYFITAQPASALVLSDVINLNESMQSPNYDKGVIDLPRLSAQYYYAFGGSQSFFYLGNTVYPTLCWTDSSIGQSATLCIYERNSNTMVFQCQIVNPSLWGIDMADMSDTSCDMVNELVNAGDAVHFYETNLTLYDPAMHKDSIVMPNYVYTPDKEYSTMSGIAYDNVCVTDNAYEFKRLVMTPAGITTHYNVKDYIAGFDSSVRAALLFAGSKFEDCSFDCNTGEVTTKVTSADDKNLYFFIATTGKCYFSTVLVESIPNDTELDQVTTDNPFHHEWVSSNTYSVLYDKADNPDYPDFGPVSYDDWFSYASKNHGIDLMSGKYGFMYRGTSDKTNVNIYAKALMYAGVEPHVATLDLLKQKRSIQLEYMVMRPGETKFNLVKTESVYTDDFSFDNLLALDEIEGYEATEWCLDQECTKIFKNNVNIDTTANTRFTIYATYKWIGGTYSVVYYNDVANVQTTQTYNTDEKPKLPEIPQAQPGYGFRNWYIVESTMAENGTPYDANTFVPETGKSYLFKTMWDVKGIITQVLTSKLTYYVGDKVDKNLLEVHVQYDNDGNTKVLKPEEFTLEQETIDKAGVNQFWVIYPETNARGMCEITGLTVAPMALNVNYLGGDTTVGTQLRTNNFRVELQYNNGNSEVINQFTINPTTIATIGTNNITISYGDISTTVQIKGISADNPTGAEIRSLNATFVGTKPKVNQKINAKDILVVVDYADGTNRTIPSDQFQFTPDTFSSAGRQRITVVYAGKNTSCEVDVEAVNASAGNNNNNSNTNNQNTNNKPTSTTGNNTSSTTTQSRPTPTTSTNNNTANKNNTAANTSSNKNQTGQSNSDKKESDAEEKEYGDSGLAAIFGNEILEPKGDSGTSIGYMHGSNILTNVMRNSADEAMVNEVDILKLIKEAGDNASSLSINLVNGASGNDITSEMLELINEKTLSLYVNMLSPMNNEVVVGRWIFVGGQLDSTDMTINPNINYETFDKPSDRLLAISLNNTTYPKGVSLTAYPAVETYGSGQLIRLYSCTVTREHSKMLRTFPWQDSANAIELDPYTDIYYCLSDAMEVYEDGSDLNINLNEVSIEDPKPDEETETGEEIGDDFWDTPEDPVTPVKKSIPAWMFIVLGVAALLLLLLIIVMAVLMIKKKSRHRTDFDDDDDELPTGSDDVEFDFDDDEEDSELPVDGEQDAELDGLE